MGILAWRKAPHAGDTVVHAWRQLLGVLSITNELDLSGRSGPAFPFTFCLIWRVQCVDTPIRQLRRPTLPRGGGPCTAKLDFSLVGRRKRW